MAERTVKVVLTAVASQYISEFKKAQQTTKTTTDDAAKRLESQKAAMQSVGKAALVMGTVAAAGLAYVVKTTADFDEKMSQVKSLSHATAADMDKLRDAALNMGQGIGFSASQVADAETELVKAGVSVKDQLGGGLKGTLDLAAAGQMDVADATQIAASAMTQFKLSGKDVPHIADLLAAGADKALGGVSELGQALKYVGPVAQSMGVSIDQTVGTLALFAQNGILADQAGTGLRGMLLSLTSPSSMASGVMKQFGINVYDTQGKFIGLDGVAGQLKKSLGGLTQQQRDQALGQIFGNNQITEATILMQGGAKSVDKWTKAVNDQGFAAEQATGKMDNLNGDLKKLGAAFQSDIIKSGSGANDVIRNLVKGATGLLQGISKIPEPVLSVGVGITGLVAGIGILGGGFVVLVPKIAATAAALRTLGVSAKGAGTALKGLSFVAIGIELAHFTSGLVDSTREAMGLSQSVDDLQKKLSKGLNKKTIDDQLNASVLGVKTNIDQLGQLTNSGWLSGLTKQSYDWIDSISKWNPVLRTVIGGTGDLTDRVKNQDKALAQMVASGHAKQAADTWDYMKSKTDGSKDALKKLNDLFPQYRGAVKSAGDANAEAAESTKKNATAIAGVGDEADDAKTAIADLADQIDDFGKGALDVSSASRDFQASIDDATKSLKDNGKTLDIGTEKGRANSAALDTIAKSAISLVTAQTNAGDSADTLSKTMATGRTAFINAATAAGMTKDAAGKLADQYKLIPSDVTTAFWASNTPVAKQAAKEVKDAIDEVPSAKNTTVTVNAYGAFSTLYALNAYLDQLGKKELTIGGSAAGYYGFNQANGSVVDYYANGGTRESHVAQIAPAGAWRVWAEPETGGEAYIPLAASKRERSLAIWAATGNRLGVAGFADGGMAQPRTYVSAPPRIVYLQQPAAAQAVPGGNTFNVTVPDPMAAALEVARRQNMLGV